MPAMACQSVVWEIACLCGSGHKLNLNSWSLCQLLCWLEQQDPLAATRYRYTPFGQSVLALLGYVALVTVQLLQ